MFFSKTADLLKTEMSCFAKPEPVSTMLDYFDAMIFFEAPKIGSFSGNQEQGVFVV